MKRVLHLGEPIPAAEIRHVPPWGIWNSLESSCHTWFGPVGVTANAALRSFGSYGLCWEC